MHGFNDTPQVLKESLVQLSVAAVQLQVNSVMKAIKALFLSNWMFQKHKAVLGHIIGTCY